MGTRGLRHRRDDRGRIGHGTLIPLSNRVQNRPVDRRRGRRPMVQHARHATRPADDRGQVPPARRGRHLAHPRRRARRHPGGEDVRRSQRRARRRSRRPTHGRRRHPRRHRAGRHLEPRPRLRTGRPARPGGRPQGRPRPARPHGQPAAHPRRRPGLRVLLRGPRAHRPPRGRLRPSRAGARRCGHRQTLRGQRHRGRPDDRRRPTPTSEPCASCTCARSRRPSPRPAPGGS